jgi:lipopolysaccharide assembly outer membrane protein LptD (OstA)
MQWLKRHLAKIGLVVASFALVFYFFNLSFTEESGPDTTKSIEIKNSLITGYSNSRISWKVKIDYMWATKSNTIYEANEILSGFIFDSEGKMVIDSIKAKGVRINTRQNSLSVFESVEARLLIRTDAQKNAVYASDASEESVKIKSGELRYVSDKKRTYLRDDVQLRKSNYVIYPKQEVEIDNDLNIAYITEGFTMRSPEYLVTGNSLTIFIDGDYSEMTGKLVFERKASSEGSDKREKNLRKNPAFLFADSALFREDESGKVLEVSHNIKIEQEGRTVEADRGIYYQSENKFIAEENVVITLENLDWMIKESAKKPKNNEINSSLRSRTVIQCNKLIYDGKERTMTLIGDVKVKQENQVIQCDKLVFLDETSEVHCYGNVRVKRKNEDSLSCSMLIINIEKEQFIAKDQVYSEFIIKKRGDQDAN